YHAKSHIGGTAHGRPSGRRLASTSLARRFLALHQPPIPIRNQPFPLLLLTTRPDDGDATFQVARLAQAEDVAAVAGGAVAAAALVEAGLLAIPHVEDDLGAHDVAMALADQFDAEPMFLA